MQWSGIGLIVVLAGLLIALLNTDWNRAKPWLNARISDAAGRPFAINGDLALSWNRPTVRETGQRGWLPWPHLIAQDITVGNPEWSKSAPHFAEIKQLAFSLDPIALLNKKIVIPLLEFEAPQLTLERIRDGRNNWTFAPPETTSAWRLELEQLVLNKGSVRIVDAIKRADVKAAIDTLPAGQDGAYGVIWKITGSFNGEAVSGSGKAGAVLSLHTQAEPYPIEASVRVGKTAISVKGNLTKPRSLAALDMRLKLSGVSMAQLYPLTGIVLPETPPFATEGHLIGTMNRQGGDWIYEKFSGKMGASDVAGTLAYFSREPRPYLEGEVVSNLLRFADLAPSIGADSNTSKAVRGVAAIQPADKVLPVEEIKAERWTSIDADVKFTGRKIIRDKELPIDNLMTKFHLKNGVLFLKPLNFGIAGGSFNADIKLDGRNKIVKAEMKIAARHLKLKQLFPTFQPMQASFGEINGDASLSATGNSIAALLGSSNGEIKALINQGTVSKLLLEEIGLNIGNIILSQIFGDKQVKLHCLASDFSVTNGRMQARTFVLDTDDATLYIGGQVDLTHEQLQLTINPRSKGLRLISLRAPLHLTGSFKNPKVKVDKGVLALKAGSAIALASVAPLAPLIPLANVGRDEENECALLLSEARAKPVVAPPGKVYRDRNGR